MKTGLQEHHIFGGPNRKKSEEDGLKVWLCLDHHTGDHGVHGIHGHEYSEHLKEEAERKYIRHYEKTIEQFRRRYGKNYL